MRSTFSKKIFFFTFVFGFIFTTPGLSQQRQTATLSKNELNQVESQIQEILNTPDFSKERVFYLKLLLGREFYNYRIDNKSKTYYQKAIDLDIDENKAEAYINIFSIHFQNKDFDKSEQALQKALEYIEKNPEYIQPAQKDFLEKMQTVFNQETIDDNDLALYDTYFKKHNLKTLIENKEYKKALQTFDPLGVQSSHIGTRTTFDLLKVLTQEEKSSPETLLCYEAYQRSPNAYSYSVKVCGILVEFLKTGEVEEDKVNELEKLLNENYQNLFYLSRAVRDLK